MSIHVPSNSDWLSSLAVSPRHCSRYSFVQRHDCRRGCPPEPRFDQLGPCYPHWPAQKLQLYNIYIYIAVEDVKLHKIHKMLVFGGKKYGKTHEKHHEQPKLMEPGPRLPAVCPGTNCETSEMPKFEWGFVWFFQRANETSLFPRSGGVPKSWGYP